MLFTLSDSWKNLSIDAGIPPVREVHLMLVYRCFIISSIRTIIGVEPIHSGTVLWRAPRALPLSYIVHVFKVSAVSVSPNCGRLPIHRCSLLYFSGFRTSYVSVDFRTLFEQRPFISIDNQPIVRPCPNCSTCHLVGAYRSM